MAGTATVGDSEGASGRELTMSSRTCYAAIPEMGHAAGD